MAEEQWTVKPVTDEPKSAQETEQAVVEEAVAETPNIEIPDDGVHRVDLDNPPEPKTKEDEPVQEQQTEEVPVEPETGDSPVVDEEVRVEPDKEEGVIERIEEEPAQEEAREPIQNPPVLEETAAPAEVEQPKLPENVEKLVSFMEETGGTLEDYVNLNRDVSKLDNISLLREYYKKTKPFLSDDQITRQLNKKFFYAEDAEPDEIEDKKIAFQEELFKAQTSFNKDKEKYYADLKLRKQSDIAPEYKEAYEGWNNYQQQLKESQKLEQDFKQKTENVFNQDFKGFDFKVGKDRFRYKVNDREKIRDSQSDITNFINKFLGKDGAVADAAGYHKALFAANNADKIAEHFYQQGHADAIKQAAKEAKNIDMSPRQDASAIVTPSGNQFRVVSGDSSSKLRIKMK